MLTGLVVWPKYRCFSQNYIWTRFLHSAIIAQVQSSVVFAIGMLPECKFTPSWAYIARLFRVDK